MRLRNLLAATAVGATLLITAVVPLTATGTANADPAGRGTVPTAADRANAYLTVKVPSVNISAPVVSVGGSGGTMDVPGNTGTLGWYNDTAQFGDLIGSMVIAGHVSNDHDAPGALYRLKNADTGDRVSITKGDKTLVYTITTMRYYPRSGSLPAAIFDNTGKSQVVLVTCGHKQTYSDGSFHYKDNLVVTATLAVAGASPA